MLSITILLAACTSSGDAPATAGVNEDPDSAGLRRSLTGVIFDPLLARTGDRVGDLVIAEVSAATAQADSTTVTGSARFRGELRLSGRTMRHHEYPDVQSVCFEADSASAAQMPRWSGDRRRAWFCFINSREAASRLAPPGEERPATIVIDDFAIYRGLSDEVNEARLVSVVPRH